MEFLSVNNKIISVLLTPSNNSTQSSYVFPTQEELQDRKIYAIEAYCGASADVKDLVAGDVLSDPNNPGTAVISPTLFQSAFLTLYTSGQVADKAHAPDWSRNQQSGLFYDKIPFPSLRRVQNNSSTVITSPVAVPSFVRTIFIMRPTEITFNKSKVEFPTPVALAANQSAVFLFHYLDKGDNGNWLMAAMGYPTTHTGR